MWSGLGISDVQELRAVSLTAVLTSLKITSVTNRMLELAAKIVSYERMFFHVSLNVCGGINFFI